MNPRSSVLTLVMLVCVYTGARADETTPAAMEKRSPSASKATVSLYDQGVAAAQANDFQKALLLFEQALRNDPDNPDVLNMFAHTQRKIGLIDEALANYKKALELRPRFPEAREYLGEAYIQAALREREVLKSYGGDAKEELEDLTQDIKEAGQKI